MYFVSQPIVTNGLVLNLDAGNTLSYTSGSSTWNDLSGNNYNSTLVNNPTFTPSNGGSVDFNGSTNYSVLTDASLKNYTTITANIWMYLNTYTSTYENYFGYNAEEAGLTQGWGLRRSGDDTFQYWGGTGNTGTKLYKNGRLVGSSVSTWTTVYGVNITGSWEMITIVATGVSSWNTHNRLVLASRSDGLASTTNMKVGLFTVYNRELTQAEIQQNFNALKGRYGL